MELTNDIKSAIAQHLPAMVAGELKEYLAQAELVRQSLADTLKANAEHRAEVERLRIQIQAQEMLTIREKSVEAKLEDVKKRELELVVATVKNEVEVIAAALAATNVTMDKFLKLPTVRTNVIENVGVPVIGSPATQYSQGSAGYVCPTNQTSNTTVSEE